MAISPGASLLWTCLLEEGLASAWFSEEKGTGTSELDTGLLWGECCEPVKDSVLAQKQEKQVGETGHEVWSGVVTMSWIWLEALTLGLQAVSSQSKGMGSRQEQPVLGTPELPHLSLSQKTVQPE